MSKFKCFFGKHTYIYTRVRKIKKNLAMRIELCKYCKRYRDAYLFNPNEFIGFGGIYDSAGNKSLYGLTRTKTPKIKNKIGGII